MKGHRPFILLSLTVSSILGSGLGGWVLLAFMGWVWLGDLGTILQAHGQLHRGGNSEERLELSFLLDELGLYEIELFQHQSGSPFCVGGQPREMLP